MKRRSFVQSLLALPAAVALSKILPVNPEPPPPIADNLFTAPPLTSYLASPQRIRITGRNQHGEVISEEIVAGHFGEISFKDITRIKVIQ
jgi:hypothetical protein